MAIPNLTGAQRLRVANAAGWLSPADRDLFWAEVARAFEGRREIGDGELGRAIAIAFKAFYKPLQLSERRGARGPYRSGKAA
jgi:hypothetical protein